MLFIMTCHLMYASVYMCAFMFVYIHESLSIPTDVCMHAGRCAWVCIYVYKNVHMHVCLCMYACMYVGRYACVCRIKKEFCYYKEFTLFSEFIISRIPYFKDIIFLDCMSGNPEFWRSWILLYLELQRSSWNYWNSIILVIELHYCSGIPLLPFWNSFFPLW